MPHRDVTMRVGGEAHCTTLLHEARTHDYAVLVSANRFWDAKRRRFAPPGPALAGLDVALDSSGFVAMRRYGGYRWSLEDYVAWARQGPWTWWAQLDWCCEPEVAGDPIEVETRQWLTAQALAETRRLLADGRPAALDPRTPNISRNRFRVSASWL